MKEEPAGWCIFPQVLTSTPHSVAISDPQKNQQSRRRHPSAPIRDDHELTLPTWGPYGNRLAGVAEIREPRDGSLFECALVPALFKGAAFPPSVRYESGWFTAEADSRLQSWATRHQLGESGVSLQCDWRQAGTGATAVAHFRNASALPVTSELIACLWMTTSATPAAEIRLPEGAIWIDALEYEKAESIHFTARLHQNSAAAPLGASYKNAGFTAARALGPNFPGNPGDRVQYRFSLHNPIRHARLIVRYHSWANGPGKFHLILNHGESIALELPHTGNAFDTADLPLGDLSAGVSELTLECDESRHLLIDGFVITPSDQAPCVGWKIRHLSPRPTRFELKSQSASLEYGDGSAYELSWDRPAATRSRRLIGDDVADMLRRTFLNFVGTEHTSHGNGCYQAVYLGPVVLEPGETVSMGFRLSRTDRPSAGTGPLQPGRLPKGNETDTAIRDGVDWLAATIASNVSYPLRFRGGYKIGEVPGMFWNSYYSWDVAFAGIAMAAIDPDRSWETLATYLTEVGDPYGAWLESGTPLPVQIYQLNELWHRTQDTEKLTWLFPRALQFYRWVVGRSHGSSNARLASGLLQTWDYNYNSGGWDDYPPQHALTQDPELRARIAPAVTTSYAIRCARILLNFARLLVEEAIAEELTSDIDKLGEAVATHAWDEASGWFSYVLHDSPTGNATGFYRHSSGQNYNRGFDGISPLVAGICSDAQADRLVAHLFDPKVLWTDFGPTTVDQSAAYHRTDGYWNGSIWMPHLWFFWRSLLDLGRGPEAFRIAKTALDLWTRESSASQRCFEHFNAATGRGQGWHHFSALSSPVINFYESLHIPGTLTHGFDSFVERKASTGGAHTWTIQNRLTTLSAWWVSSGDSPPEVRLDSTLVTPTRLMEHLWLIEARDVATTFELEITDPA